MPTIQEFLHLAQIFLTLVKQVPLNAVIRSFFYIFNIIIFCNLIISLIIGADALLFFKLVFIVNLFFVFYTTALLLSIFSSISIMCIPKEDRRKILRVVVVFKILTKILSLLFIFLFLRN
jgi:hypothetical protein